MKIFNFFCKETIVYVDLFLDTSKICDWLPNFASKHTKHFATKTHETFRYKNTRNISPQKRMKHFATKTNEFWPQKHTKHFETKRHETFRHKKTRNISPQNTRNIWPQKHTKHLATKTHSRFRHKTHWRFATF